MSDVNEEFGGSQELGIDCHTHVYPKGYVDELQEMAEFDPALEGSARAVTNIAHRHPPEYEQFMLGAPEERFAIMEQAGIGAQILSAGSSMAFPAGARFRAELSRAWNDGARESAQAFPDRFKLFASLPMPEVEESVAESVRVAGWDETAGFCINSHTLGVHVDDERWYPLYEAWNEMGALVFVHPNRFCAPGILSAQLEMDLGTQLDDAIVAAKLYSSGILKKFPRIRWIVAHLGGAFSFVLGRLDEHWERDREWRAQQEPPSRSLDGLYFDTGGHKAGSMAFAIETLGADKFVLGSDFPAVNAHDLPASTTKLAAACPEDADRRKIMRDTILSLI